VDAETIPLPERDTLLVLPAMLMLPAYTGAMMPITSITTRHLSINPGKKRPLIGPPLLEYFPAGTI
jgi:hypothetical protein